MTNRILILGLPVLILASSAKAEDPATFCITSRSEDYITVNAECLKWVRHQQAKLRKEQEMKLQHDYLYRPTGEVLL